MSYGDKLLAIGDAWRIHQADPGRRRVAIGDGRTIDLANTDLCWGLDFLATQEQVDRREDVLWVISHKSCRPYVDYEAMRSQANYLSAWRRYLPSFLLKPNPVSVTRRYIWKQDYRPTPAPIKLRPEEQAIADEWGRFPFIALEPYIKASAPPAKQWPVVRFAEVARVLSKEVPVYQISAPSSMPLPNLPQILTSSFRESLAYLKAASLYIGPEGGLHHGAAAMGTQAVVIFGGFIWPQTTGYPFHVNLTGTSDHACGTRYEDCAHCERAMNSITVDEVVEAARRLLADRANLQVASSITLSTV